MCEAVASPLAHADWRLPDQDTEAAVRCTSIGPGGRIEQTPHTVFDDRTQRLVDFDHNSGLATRQRLEVIELRVEES